MDATLVVNILAIHYVADAVYVLVVRVIVKGVLVVVNGAVQADAKDATDVKADAGRNVLVVALEIVKAVLELAVFLARVFVKENVVSLVAAIVRLDALALVNQIVLDAMDVQTVVLLLVLVALGAVGVIAAVIVGVHHLVKLHVIQHVMQIAKGHVMALV